MRILAPNESAPRIALLLLTQPTFHVEALDVGDTPAKEIDLWVQANIVWFKPCTILGIYSREESIEAVISNDPPEKINDLAEVDFTIETTTAPIVGAKKSKPPKQESPF